MTGPDREAKNMEERKQNPEAFGELKKQAEERLGKFPGPGDSPDNLHRLVHELAVHKVELEMQNEELIASRDELERSLERYKELYDFAPIGYATLSCEGKIREANLAAAAMLGVARSKIAGASFDSFVAEEERPLFDRIFAALFSGNGPSVFELRLMRKQRPKEQSSPAEAPDSPAAGTQLSVRIDTAVNQDSRECRIAMTDISEQKVVEVENAALQVAMAQVMRMESIGRLAGGIAHDFNNMLQVMLCNVEMMDIDEKSKRFRPERLSEMRNCIEKSANLVRQLLAFARSQPFHPEVLDLNTMVANMMTILGRLLGENIMLSYSRSPHPMLVKMDPSQVDQILANLTVNARDAIRGCGEVNIGISDCNVVASDSWERQEVPPGHYARLSVSDNGSGIDPAILDKIFEPFFSTKSLAESSGLGLASVYGIVRQNNGFIRVSSEVGKGTTFEILLPLCSAVEPQAPLSADTFDVSTGHESILLVEDDEGVRGRTAEFLEKCGYTVFQAGEPEEAIRLFDAMLAEIDLLVTDMVMPGMSGRDLARKLTAKRPGLPCLFISGYSMESPQMDSPSGSGMTLLSKPYSLSSLALAVRSRLDAAG
ncbi:MAG: response regulator [Chlorobiaceae bacterium]|nr:response regulator [Chlorobiaceae bacterium]